MAIFVRFVRRTLNNASRTDIVWDDYRPASSKEATGNERQREPKEGSRERGDASQLESLLGGLLIPTRWSCLPSNGRDQQHHLSR